MRRRPARAASMGGEHTRPRIHRCPAATIANSPPSSKVPNFSRFLILLILLSPLLCVAACGAEEEGGSSHSFADATSVSELVSAGGSGGAEPRRRRNADIEQDTAGRDIAAVVWQWCDAQQHIWLRASGSRLGGRRALTH